ncbi:MAG TPA: flagellar hook-basal body complex protein FliE [Stellaceae bacterium]|nr:flagellar hook-basal body complex protein FliE [Stellaceae bacterium]
MVEAIAAMQGILSELASLAGAAGDADAAAAPASTAPSGSASFAALFDTALNRLDSDVAGADTKVQAFASGGNDIALSDVMVSLEQANLALQMASNVRDKVTAAYSNVMNMQI